MTSLSCRGSCSDILASGNSSGSHLSISCGGFHQSQAVRCAADACNDSPARQPSVIAVGAIALGDGMASFSNGGSCIDILAPGVSILSAAPGSPTATA